METEVPGSRLFAEKQTKRTAPTGAGPDANGEPALMHAAWDGKLKILRLLINAGANPNPQDRNGDCPLLFASWQGHLPVIEALCSAPNINPNLQNKKGFTALMIALVSEQLGHDREKQL